MVFGLSALIDAMSPHFGVVIDNMNGHFGPFAGHLDNIGVTLSPLVVNLVYAQIVPPSEWGSSPPSDTVERPGKQVNGQGIG